MSYNPNNVAVAVEREHVLPINYDIALLVMSPVSCKTRLFDVLSASHPRKLLPQLTPDQISAECVIILLGSHALISTISSTFGLDYQLVYGRVTSHHECVMYAFIWTLRRIWPFATRLDPFTDAVLRVEIKRWN